MTSDRIHCFSDTITSAPTLAKAPSVLTPDRLAEVLAILTANIVDALGPKDRRAVMEKIANRADEQSRVTGGSVAASMLGAVGGALMRLEG